MIGVNFIAAKTGVRNILAFIVEPPLNSMIAGWDINQCVRTQSYGTDVEVI